MIYLNNYGQHDRVQQQTAEAEARTLVATICWYLCCTPLHCFFRGHGGRQTTRAVRFSFVVSTCIYSQVWYRQEKIPPTLPPAPASLESKYNIADSNMKEVLGTNAGTTAQKNKGERKVTRRSVLYLSSFFDNDSRWNSKEAAM